VVLPMTIALAYLWTASGHRSRLPSIARRVQSHDFGVGRAEVAVAGRSRFHRKLKRGGCGPLQSAANHQGATLTLAADPARYRRTFGPPCPAAPHERTSLWDRFPCSQSCMWSCPHRLPAVLAVGERFRANLHCGAEPTQAVNGAGCGQQADCSGGGVEGAEPEAALESAGYGCQGTRWLLLTYLHTPSVGCCGCAAGAIW